jgi:hypothetical protein
LALIIEFKNIIYRVNKKEGVKIMSFLKKLGETMMDTASSIGTKSVDLMETGKLKLQRSQLESSVNQKKSEIGNLIYAAYKQDCTADSAALAKVFNEIKELEIQIAEIDEKLHKETV